MRKLLALPMFLSASLTGGGIALAAPDGIPKCTPLSDYEKVKEKDSTGKEVEVLKIENGNYVFKAGVTGVTENCFADEIFVLDGDLKVTLPGTPGTMGMPGTPGGEVDLVECKAADGKECVIGKLADQLKGGGYEAAAQKALEQIKAKVPTLPEWDQIVLFSADFAPAAAGATGPLFFRVNNAAGRPINDVANLAPPGVLDRTGREPTKPYIGVISAGNTRTIGATPWSGTFSPCGTAPRRPIDNPSPSEQPGAALCAPGLYTYFDALAQATAHLYGPYLGVAPAFGTNFNTLPLIKGALVEASATSVNPKFPAAGWPGVTPAGGPTANVWNAFLNTQGSILGGNTWRDSGNGTYSATRPPAFQGVSAPFEGAQSLRFTPIDLYVLGLITSGEVGDIQSFIKTTPGQVFQPAVGSFGPAVGPHMHTRITGVSIRPNSSEILSFPRDIAGANGGERTPDANTAPQHIRQLWVLVTKPRRVIDAMGAAAQMAMGAAADAGAKVIVTELRNQAAQIEPLVRHRPEFNRYYYTLTGYRGRVHTHFEGNTDDMGYWEFGDKRDDAKEFTAGGGLTLQVPGPEEVPNSGGKLKTVARVNTGGEGGHLIFTPQGRTLKVAGSKKDAHPAANNMLTIRMQIPADAPKDLKGRIVFKGTGVGDASITFPTFGDAYLLADGKPHNYVVDLTATPFADGEYNSFLLYPANAKVDGIEIDFVKISWIAAANLKDSDKDCAKVEAKADGWLDVEDNCKNLFNPDQADGNGDGVGDACEDYDGDNVVNSCDNCPTVTNSSQRNSNGNSFGDACDGDKPSDCFFQTSAVGGPVSPTSAIVWVAGLILGAIVTSAVRRRRRRR